MTLLVTVFLPENRYGSDGDSIAEFGVVFDENNPGVGTGSLADSDVDNVPSANSLQLKCNLICI